jgi:4-carboxymuconolactone decarboxylase
VEAALAVGATKQQVVETILQLTFYAGGPAVRNSLVGVRDLVAEPGVGEAGRAAAARAA